MWTWPHYVVFFWQIFAAAVTLYGYWIAEDPSGRPKYTWTGLVGVTALYGALVFLFNWILAQGGFWP